MSRQLASYEPGDWREYFDRRSSAELDAGSFSYHALGLEPGAEGPLLVFVHGGGFSSLSWSVLCHELASRVHCSCVAMDARGHGETRAVDEEDFSLDTLAADVEQLIAHLVASGQLAADRPLALIGHSMGGAVVTQVAHRGHLATAAALVVIDVVEGSALEALASMRSLLAGRPKSFPTLAAGIEWCHRSGTVRNLQSARVSFPGHLRPLADGEGVALATKAAKATKVEPIAEGDEAPDDGETAAPMPRPLPPLAPKSGPRLLAENRRRPQLPRPQPLSHQLQPQQQQQQDSGGGYTWRIDLLRTEPHWPGWFSGLSAKFLACRPAKLLLLAGVDRLDKQLTVGQMQGKFQLQVLPRSGHAVHEDHPDHVAEVLAAFLVRHRLAPAGANFRPAPPGC